MSAADDKRLTGIGSVANLESGKDGDASKSGGAMAGVEHEIDELISEIDRSDRELLKLENAPSTPEHVVGELRDRLSDLTIKLHTRLISAILDSRIGQFQRSQSSRQFTGAMRALFVGGRAIDPAKAKDAAFRIALYLHYRVLKRRKDVQDLADIASSGLFDPAYYLTHSKNEIPGGNDPLTHYVDVGAKLLLDPSLAFSTEFYLRLNPDVAAAGINPLLHYVRRGKQEGRRIKPPIATLLQEWAPPPRLLSATARPAKPQRIVIYTAISGGYDELKPPDVRPAGCEFVVLTDRPLGVSGWTERPLNFAHPESARAARFAKLHPHLYFGDYDRSIWIDGNIGIRGDIGHFLNGLTEQTSISTFLHSLRNCVYQEAEACIQDRRDDPTVVRRQMQRYREQGYPERHGLWETGVMARRHNDPACIALMTAWWREIETGSFRDQLSLPVVAQRLAARISPLDRPGASAYDHPLLKYIPHRGKPPV